MSWVSSHFCPPPHPLPVSDHPSTLTLQLTSLSLWALLASLMGISINMGALGAAGPWRLNVWHLEPRRQIPVWTTAASPLYLFLSLLLLEKKKADWIVLEPLPVCTFLDSWQAADSSNLHTYLQICHKKKNNPLICTHCLYHTRRSLLSWFDFK